MMKRGLRAFPTGAETTLRDENDGLKKLVVEYVLIEVVTRSVWPNYLSGPVG